MKITVVGAGWVGVVSAAAFAHFGHEVLCVDLQKERIELLNNEQGQLPFFEPGLRELVTEGQRAKKLQFRLVNDEAFKEAEVVMCAVGTPPQSNGAADLSAVFACARDYGRFFGRRSVFVMKSTVPPGTMKRVREIIDEELRVRQTNVSYAVASNPEFLAEGTAVKDVLTPERVIIGCDSDRFVPVLEELYRPLITANVPIIFMSVASAELTKYAANSFLATKISFMNEIANYAELVGANMREVAMGMESDSRIGNKFLRSGVGYGGSCFPKDVRAIVAAGQEAGYRFRILPEVDRVNTIQRVRYYDKLLAELGGSVKGKKIAVWGLSYKPETDDVREAPAIYFIDRLEREGAQVIAYDPEANAAMRMVFPNLQVAESADMAIRGADALLLLTDWPEFIKRTPLEIRSLMRGAVIIDGRGVWQK